MAERQPWLRMPIQIGRPGYYSDPNVNPFANPLVNTDLTVGPWLGYTPSDVSGGISGLLNSATNAFNKATKAKPKAVAEDRATRVRPPFQLGPVPGPNPADLAKLPNFIPANSIMSATYDAPVPALIEQAKTNIKNSPTFEGPVPLMIKNAVSGVQPDVEYRDGVPYIKGTNTPYESVLTKGGLPDWSSLLTAPATPSAAAVPIDPNIPAGQPSATQYPVDPNILTANSPSAKVLPPDPNDPNRPTADPNANPADPNAAPPVVPLMPETALPSLDASMAEIRKAFPDLEFGKNPAQDKADANAAHDMERTQLLAQLAFASGIVSGAGKSWQGLGTGFANAAGTYDKGFEKYQNALQSSADRYQRQQEQVMTYDTARRQSALSLYTSTAAQNAENQRAYIKMVNDRQWDATKLGVEQQREDIKQSHDDINRFYDRKLKPFEPASDPTTADPADEERKRNRYEQILRERERALAHGYIISDSHDVADQ